MYTLIAQLIGILASILLIVSFQIKNNFYMFAAQCAANLLFGINYFMLGSYTGAAIMILGTVNMILLMVTRGKQKIWMYFMLVAYVAMTWYTCIGIKDTLFLVFSILVGVAQFANTMAMWSYKGMLIRKVRITSSPFWLIYNILSKSTGAIIAEIFTAVSIATYLIRNKGKETE